LHKDGKAALDHIYTEPDPRAYFSTLRGLEYQIPQLAKPHFGQLIAELRRTRNPVTILDIGCSYGINAALLRCDLSMAELYDRYDNPDASVQTRQSLVERDRELVADRDRLPGTVFLGLDASTAALSYATSAGFIDEAVPADLEHDPATPAQLGQLARADLVISTGCIGYVTERTIGQVACASGDRPPWMAHVVLRMYPFDPVARCLARFGYETRRVDGLLRQRRFAAPEEQAQVVDRLTDIGIDPAGRESDGWLYAELFISRPCSG
jgi:carnitine O-acetyltransferase